MKGLFIIVILSLFVIQLGAQIKTDKIEYTQGDSVTITFEGYLVYDRLLKSKRSGILLIHEKWGQDDFIRESANKLAELGYVIFAIDMYGKGVLAKDQDSAEDMAEPFYNDRTLTRERAKAGLQILKNNNRINPMKIGVLGYGFGGTAALELACAGEDLKCVVCFHSRLNTVSTSDIKNIRGSVLILHGANDPNISSEELNSFQKNLADAEVDWQLVIFGNAVYGFSNKSFGFETDDGIAYNYKAEKRSWEIVKIFLEEIFK